MIVSGSKSLVWPPLYTLHLLLKLHCAFGIVIIKCFAKKKKVKVKKSNSIIIEGKLCLKSCEMISSQTQYPNKSSFNLHPGLLPYCDHMTRHFCLQNSVIISDCHYCFSTMVLVTEDFCFCTMLLHIHSSGCQDKSKVILSFSKSSTFSQGLRI